MLGAIQNDVTPVKGGWRYREGDSVTRGGGCRVVFRIELGLTLGLVFRVRLWVNFRLVFRKSNSSPYIGRFLFVNIIYLI